MRRVVDFAGLAFPRGVLGPEAMDLATALGLSDADPELIDTLVRRVAAAQWIALQGPMNAALARVDAPTSASDAQSLERARVFAEDADPENPFALALAERAGHDLAAVRARALDRLEALAAAQADGADRPEALVALASTAGRITADLLDLDPDDFAAEVAAYADVDTTAEAASPALVRATGDEEIRAWAREALSSLEVPAPPNALAAVRSLAAGPVPADPTDDVLWTATIIVLAEDAIDLATTEVAPGGDEQADDDD
jgi:hypothetical protein